MESLPMHEKGGVKILTDAAADYETVKARLDLILRELGPRQVELREYAATTFVNEPGAAELYQTLQEELDALIALALGTAHEATYLRQDLTGLCTEFITRLAQLELTLSKLPKNPGSENLLQDITSDLSAIKAIVEQYQLSRPHLSDDMRNG
jgi:hypothetical protein